MNEEFPEKTSRIIPRFGGLFNKRRKDRELDDEIESHLQMQIEDNLRLSGGEGRSDGRTRVRMIQKQ